MRNKEDKINGLDKEVSYMPMPNKFIKYSILHSVYRGGNGQGSLTMLGKSQTSSSVL